MPEVADQRFGCDGCGKTYPWKPELTNKKAKCKCGAVITVPDLSAPPPSDDDPPALPDADIFDFIENAPEIASPRAESFRAAVAVPVAVPAAKKKGAAGVLPYRSGPTQRERNRQAERLGSIHDMKRDVYVPAGLIVGAFAAYFAWLFIHGNANSGSSVAIYGMIMFAMFAVKTLCMIGGAFIVASVAGVSFGPFWTAVLKLAAVAVAPDVFATILQEAIGVPGASLIAGSLSLAFYWILISQLFNMDAGEAWIVVVLFGFLRWILTFIIGMVLLGMLLSGSGVGSSAMSGVAAVAASTAAIAFDEKVEAAKENNSLIEGIDYINDKSRQTDMLGPIKSFYAAGARNVWFMVARDINGKTEPLAVVIEWPRDAKKRAAVLKSINDCQKDRAAALEKQHPDWGKIPVDLVKDEGGKYVEVGIGL